MAARAPDVITETITKLQDQKSASMEEQIIATGKERMTRCAAELALKAQAQYDAQLEEKFEEIRASTQEEVEQVRRQRIRDRDELEDLVGVLSRDDNRAARQLLASSSVVLRDYLDRMTDEPKKAGSSGGSDDSDSLPEEGPEMEERPNLPTVQAATHRYLMALTPQKPARRAAIISRPPPPSQKSSSFLPKPVAAEDVQDNLPRRGTKRRVTRDEGEEEAKEDQYSPVADALCHTASTGDIHEEIPSRRSLRRKTPESPVSRSLRDHRPLANYVSSGAPAVPFGGTRSSTRRATRSSTESDARGPPGSHSSGRPSRHTAKAPSTYNEKAYFKALKLPNA